MVKEILGTSDRETIEAIAKNPYTQFFLGMPSYSVLEPFDSSSMTHFRKRFGDAMIRKVNELLVSSQKDAAEPAPTESMNLKKLTRLLFVLAGFLEFWAGQVRNLYLEVVFSNIVAT